MPFAQPAATYQLVIKTLFNRLTQREKLYAHFLARAAWHGSRIILRQTSPEGPGILDFITKLYEVCDGRWIELAKQSGVGVDELNNFLEFSGHFLSNLGNYFVGSDALTPTLLIVVRATEIGRSFQKFLKTAFASWPVHPQKPLLHWNKSLVLSYRYLRTNLDSPTVTTSQITTLARNASQRTRFLRLPKLWRAAPLSQRTRGFRKPEMAPGPFTIFF